MAARSVAVFVERCGVSPYGCPALEPCEVAARAAIAVARVVVRAAAVEEEERARAAAMARAAADKQVKLPPTMRRCLMCRDSTS